jgi:hypothetical protein
VSHPKGALALCRNVWIWLGSTSQNWSMILFYWSTRHKCSVCTLSILVVVKNNKNTILFVWQFLFRFCRKRSSSFVDYCIKSDDKFWFTFPMALSQWFEKSVNLHCQVKVVFFWVLGYVAYCTLIGKTDLWSILQQAWNDIIISFKTRNQDLEYLSLKQAMPAIATNGGYFLICLKFEQK